MSGGDVYTLRQKNLKLFHDLCMQARDVIMHQIFVPCLLFGQTLMSEGHIKTITPSMTKHFLCTGFVKNIGNTSASVLTCSLKEHRLHHVQQHCTLSFKY